MGGLAQQGGQRAQQGLSHQEMAQQAERKRRFTEQKREEQLQQVLLCQLTAVSWVKCRLLFGNESLCNGISRSMSKQIVAGVTAAVGSEVPKCLLAALQPKRDHGTC